MTTLLTYFSGFKGKALVPVSLLRNLYQSNQTDGRCFRDHVLASTRSPFCPIQVSSTNNKLVRLGTGLLDLCQRNSNQSTQRPQRVFSGRNAMDFQPRSRKSDASDAEQCWCPRIRHLLHLRKFQLRHSNRGVLSGPGDQRREYKSDNIGGIADFW